jgi:hypothetical protein
MKRIILVSMLLPACMLVEAQDAFRNNGNMQVHAGGSLSGMGNFTNATGATLINNGTLYLNAGAVNDQSSMAAGTGTLYLNGSSAQSVSGSQPWNVFDLITSNTTGITLNNNLHVNGTHTFSAGLVGTSATPNYLVYEAGSSYTGSSDAAHVNGWVKKIGNTDFAFPVGNATYLRPVALTGLSASGEFNARYSSGTPGTTSFQAPLKVVNAGEYWTINKTSGGTASVVLNWDNSKVGFPNWIISDIVAANWNGSAWTDAGGTATGNVTTTGTVTSNAFSTFGNFTFASKTFPVPLTLIKFTATRQSSYTRVAWTTVNEQNVSHHVVERSDDNTRFYSIGQLPARNSGNLENYFLDDTRPINGTAWYRLRSVDFDSRESMSKIVSVKADGDDNLALVANPVYDKVVLRAGRDLAGNFQYQVYQQQGQLIQQGTLAIRSGETTELPLKTALAPGNYILRVTNGTRSFEYKIIQL